MENPTHIRVAIKLIWLFVVVGLLGLYVYWFRIGPDLEESFSAPDQRAHRGHAFLVAVSSPGWNQQAKA